MAFSVVMNVQASLTFFIKYVKNKNPHLDWIDLGEELPGASAFFVEL